MADAVDAGKFKDVTDAASMNIKFTQWSYHNHDMSPALSSATGKVVFMFQNWGQHYATVFLPQLWRTLLTGESPITGVMGKKYTLTNPERYALLSHLSLLAGIGVIGSQLGFDMNWLSPTSSVGGGRFMGKPTMIPVSPMVNTLVDIGWLTGEAMIGNNDGVNDALRTIVNYDLPTVVPAGIALRRMARVVSGELPPQALILPVKKPKKVGYKTGYQGNYNNSYKTGYK
jgi:hypothetical protein